MVPIDDLREQLVKVALNWERAFGNEHLILGCTLDAYSKPMQGATAVQNGHDFVFNGASHQVKGNRPSGKRGSVVTWVPKAVNYD